jgi:dolichol kinase
VRPIAHVVTSGIISAFVWIGFRSFGCAAVSFITGIFIDLDHLVDFYSQHKFTLKLKRIYCACLRVRFKKLYLLLHSYEIIAMLWAAICVFSLSNMWKAAAIGITQHIIFDQITNPINTFGYFFTYRVMKGFRKELILHPDLITEAKRCPR